MRRDPRAVRFVNWWERVRDQYDPDVVFWPNGFAAYFADFGLSVEEECQIYQDASDEYWERQWVAAHSEPEGMVVTDLEQVPEQAV